MDLIKQFSVFLVNKPGVLAQVTKVIAQAKINIQAMTMTDSSEHGVLRLVGKDADKLRRALASLNLPTTETDVLMVTMANRAGALADVCQKLAEAHINISYAYCTTGASGGKTKSIFKVADNQKAMRILKEKGSSSREDKHKVYRQPGLR